MYSVLGWFYLTVLPGWLGLDDRRPRRLAVGDRQVGAHLPRASRCSPGSSPARSARPARAPSGTRTRSCPASARSRSTACCSRSSCSSPSRASRSPSNPLDVARVGVAAARLLRRHVDRRVPRRATGSASPTTATPRWRSPRRATTSSSPSPSSIARVRRHLGPGPRRHDRPAHRGARPASGWSTWRSGRSAAGTADPDRPRQAER